MIMGIISLCCTYNYGVYIIFIMYKISIFDNKYNVTVLAFPVSFSVCFLVFYPAAYNNQYIIIYIIVILY